MNFGATELLVVLAIVLLLFGTKKLKTLGSDLGDGIKGFRKAMQKDDANDNEQTAKTEADQLK